MTYQQPLENDTLETKLNCHSKKAVVGHDLQCQKLLLSRQEWLSWPDSAASSSRSRASSQPYQCCGTNYIICIKLLLSTNACS